MSKIRLVGILLTMAAMMFGSAQLRAASADRVALVKDRVPVATIVVGEKLPAAEQYAAQELQKYLKKISGAQLPIGVSHVLFHVLGIAGPDYGRGYPRLLQQPTPCGLGRDLTIFAADFADYFYAVYCRFVGGRLK